jgi:hypothetical protein
MTTIVIIALIAAALVAAASVSRTAVHAGVETWPAD